MTKIGDGEVVGTVGELWRFPVKSMQGEAMTSVDITLVGVEGDRRYGVIDGETGQVLSAKRYGDLLELSARTAPDGSVTVTFPDGREFGADDTSIHEALSGFLGRPCRLESRRSGAPVEFEMSFNAEAPDTDLFAWPCPPDTFVDLAGAHLLTSSSLSAATALHPEGDWHVCRFRPTALVITESDGFVEDSWVGGSVHLGGATLTIDMPTIRCPMPSRAQPGGIVRDLGVARTLRDHHDSNLGVYASVAGAGLVQVGDAVELVRSS